MDYTKNYHLPHWEKSDRIRMEDFNEMCGNIEKGMGAAQSEAEAAHAAAGAAMDKASAAYAPDQKPYAVGSYIGNGYQVVVELGFRPSFLIISGARSVTTAESAGIAYYNLITAGNVSGGSFTFTDTGFTVQRATGKNLPALEVSGRVYDYIAFR